MLRGSAFFLGAALALFAAPALADGRQGSEPPAPIVIRVSPSSGPPGTKVTIVGQNFLPGSTVIIGGREAEILEMRGDLAVAVAGPHKPGRVSVEVRNARGRGGVLGGAFRYEAPAAEDAPAAAP